MGVMLVIFFPGVAGLRRASGRAIANALGRLAGDFHSGGTGRGMSGPVEIRERASRVHHVQRAGWRASRGLAAFNASRIRCTSSAMRVRESRRARVQSAPGSVRPDMR